MKRRIVDLQGPMTARILQIAFAVALVWLLALPRPAPEKHWTYRPCDLIQQFCTIT
jgi:hypothetical protein